MDEPIPVVEPVLPSRSNRLGWLVVAMVVLAVGAVVAWLVLTRASAPGPGTPRLAIIELDGGLAQVDDNGELIRRHELPGMRLQFPAWAPDGTRIAAVGGDGETAGVFVFDADPLSRAPATTIYESADRPAFYLYWTPDSQRVTFLTTEPTGIALRVAPADGSAPSQIVREAAPLYWDFVDPSRVLLHTGANSPEAFIGEVGLDGTAFDDAAPVAGVFRAPAIAADGRSRVFVEPAESGPPGAQQLVVEARDGSGRQEVPIEGNVAFGFDPTSTRLAFIASGAAADITAAIPVGPLRTVDTGTGEVRTLLERQVFAFFWSPDGETIAVIAFPNDAQPGPGEAGAPGTRTVASARGIPPLAAEPGGVRFHLGFVDAASGTLRGQRDVRLTELFAFQLLPFFDQYALSHRFWASDSSAIALPISGDAGLEQVVVYPADGGEPRTVATGGIGFWSP